MDNRRQLIKDMEDTWPFYGVSIPKTMKCEDGEISEAGEEFYDGDESSEGCFWETAEFYGKFVNVGFSAKEKFRGGPIKIGYDFLSIQDPNSTRDLKTLIDELTFVKEVVESGD
jgi:hypothetical protein